MKPRRSDFTTAFLRSFAVQGSWNYRTMIGGGMGFALAPLLQRIHAGDPVALRAAVERQAASFNAHPYMSPIAIGALARVELDGLDDETIVKFRVALRGPLGALGDRAIWAGWRPLCVLGTMVAFCLGLDAVVAVVSFFLVYNAGHVSVRVWGFRLGWEAGLEVGGVLRRSAMRKVSGRFTPVNQALTGIALVVLIARTPGLELGPGGTGLAAATALAAFFLPARAGTGAIIALIAAGAIWWV